MKTHFSLHHHTSQKLALAIGNYDGLHLGHQSLLATLIKDAKSQGLQAAVLTFSNHPSEILFSEAKVQRVLTPLHKELLMKEYGIDLLIMPAFTHEISLMEPREFLQMVHERFPFSYLILGHDATLGHKRRGTQEVVKQIGKELGFSELYLPEISFQGKRLRSSLLRQAIRDGNFKETRALTGRPYSICQKIIEGAGYGKTIGYPTANMDVQGLCLPPFGVYEAAVKLDDRFVPAIANLGFAPTMHEERSPRLETHLLHYSEDLTGRTIEVLLRRYLRPEKKFSSLEALREQIERDIKNVAEADSSAF